MALARRRVVLASAALCLLAVFPGVRAYTWLTTRPIGAVQLEATTVLSCLARELAACPLDEWQSRGELPDSCATACTVAGSTYRFRRVELATGARGVVAHGQEAPVYGDVWLHAGDETIACYSVRREQRTWRGVPRVLTGGGAVHEDDRCVDAMIVASGLGP